MEREDPLERLERQEAEKKNSNGVLKAVMIAMIIVAVALAIGLYFVLTSKNKLVNDLNTEKVELTEQIQALQADYENLSSDYDTINAQLDSSREEIAQLVDRVKKTEATDRAKIRQYQKEIGTLRAIMKSYIKQIDSLNTLNIELREEAREAHREAEQHKQKYADLKKISDKNAERASAGAVLKARGISLTAINKSNKSTDRSSRANKLKACLSLIENQIAEKGDRTVYIKVFAPDGTQLGGSQQTPFTCKGEDMIASASRVVDYQGEEIEVCVYFTRSQDAKFSKGVYRVEVYTSESALGSAELVLR